MTSAPAQPAGGVSSPTLRASVVLAAADIKLAHSVFALPFACLAAFLARPAAGSWGAFAGQFGLVVACMVTARTWAMLVNRLADRRYDADNPRTARRLTASGALPARHALLIALVSAGLFVGCCAMFWVFFGNVWPVVLSLPVLVWIGGYSLAKRFTSLSHVWLGASLAMSPVAAGLAVEPASLAGAPAICLISGMVLLWVAGFDIIYALQDVAFDRRAGLFSLPARLGPGRAIWISRLFHAGAAALLVLAWLADDRLGAIFGVAVAGTFGLLAAEHVVLARRGERGLALAFFTLNGVVSLTLGAAGILDVLV